jgi:hypothetical protein
MRALKLAVGAALALQAAGAQAAVAVAALPTPAGEETRITERVSQAERSIHAAHGRQAALTELKSLKEWVNEEEKRLEGRDDEPWLDARMSLANLAVFLGQLDADALATPQACVERAKRIEGLASPRAVDAPPPEEALRVLRLLKDICASSKAAR